MKTNWLLFFSCGLMIVAFAVAATQTQQRSPVADRQQPPKAEPVETLAQRGSALRERLRGTDYTVVVEKPFVVIGNQKPTEVKRWASGTIRWAVNKLKTEYFEKEPGEIIEIWLFKDAETYKPGAKSLVGYEPTTPYGFYSSDRKVLVMNISTGGGTLVHEIVHPFIETNFPECPSWFNEGLASLYEQSSERDSRIVGLTNWRLRGLQLAIKDQRLGSFQRLTSTTTREFYDGDATNYAQARYLCYWLQEKGKLKEYYKAFRANCTLDPTGIKALNAQIAPQAVPEFQEAWEKWVLTLRFP